MFTVLPWKHDAVALSRLPFTRVLLRAQASSRPGPLGRRWPRALAFERLRTTKHLPCRFCLLAHARKGNATEGRDGEFFLTGASVASRARHCSGQWQGFDSGRPVLPLSEMIPGG